MRRLVETIKGYGRGGVKFQAMSDLHLEILPNQDYTQFNFPVTAPFLLLAGDIGRLAQKEAYAAFLSFQAARYEKVFLVLGNHEFYGSSRSEAFDHLKRILDDGQLHSKVIVLDRRRFDVSDRVTILGCTLHTQIPPESVNTVSSKVADFRRIEAWTVTQHNDEHNADKQWLKSNVETLAREEPHRSLIIATHHAPTCQGTSDPRHAQNPWNSAFATEVIRSEASKWSGIELVKCWVFGHTHHSCDFRIGKLRLYANQRGYVLTPSQDQRRKKKTQRSDNGPRHHCFDPESTVTV